MSYTLLIYELDNLFIELDHPDENEAVILNIDSRQTDAGTIESSNP